MRKMDFYTRLVYARQLPIIGKLSYYLLKILGSEIPMSVDVGEGFCLNMVAMGSWFTAKQELDRGPHLSGGHHRARGHLPANG